MNPNQLSDQSIDPGRLSTTAQRMLALRDEVLLEWSQRLRATVKEAEQLPHPILTNTFPCLYANLAAAITPDYHGRTKGGRDTVAFEHGGERARLTNYNAQAVISEYQLLRWTIFDVLQRHGIPLNNEEFSTINASIDNAIRESVSAFALAQSALREQFAAALTHDLRNPLATASIAAELIHQGAESPRIKQLAQRIASNLNRMDGMIRDVLDAMVFQAGERLRLHLAHFDLLALAQEVCDQFASVHGPRFSLHGESVRGCWDREALKRALENLIGNAVKYGAAGSPIGVQLSQQHERAILSVHNDGEPIAPENLEYVFQVFRRATSPKHDCGQGWGIGLPYVRAVAESHGGSVVVDSAAERGTTFSITIPTDARPYQHAPILGTLPP